MTKSDIIQIVSEGTGLSKVETQTVLEGFFATVRYAMKQNDRVEIRGFGSFKKVKRNARTARNPKTNESVEVPEHDTVVFRPAKTLKAFINEKND